jgi:hypothetical protein
VVKHVVMIMMAVNSGDQLPGLGEEARGEQNGLKTKV